MDPRQSQCFLNQIHHLKSLKPMMGMSVFFSRLGSSQLCCDMAVELSLCDVFSFFLCAFYSIMNRKIYIPTSSLILVFTDVEVSELEVFTCQSSPATKLKRQGELSRTPRNAQSPKKKMRRWSILCHGQRGK